MNNYGAKDFLLSRYRLRDSARNDVHALFVGRETPSVGAAKEQCSGQSKGRQWKKSAINIKRQSDCIGGTPRAASSSKTGGALLAGLQVPPLLSERGTSATNSNERLTKLLNWPCCGALLLGRFVKSARRLKRTPITMIMNSRFALDGCAQDVMGRTTPERLKEREERTSLDSQHRLPAGDPVPAAVLFRGLRRA